LPAASLLGSATPLSMLLPERLRCSGAWRDKAGGLKAAREVARQRYRELQGAFVSAPARVAPDAGEALLRYTYGTHGRHWAWAESARRILDRVTVLNRATLALLASAARGESSVRFDPPSFGLPTRNFDAPGSVLDALAEALPPVAMPDWVRLVGALAPDEPALSGEESIERYQSLFAEMLGLSTHPEGRT
jgi:hypothetical protein